MIKFPEDFLEERHPLAIQGDKIKDTNPKLFNLMINDWGSAKRWTYPTDRKPVISIVGGGYGLYGDGVHTFEMYDFREDSPRGYMTKEEINKHLDDNPIIPIT